MAKEVKKKGFGDIILLISMIVGFGLFFYLGLDCLISRHCTALASASNNFFRFSALGSTYFGITLLFSSTLFFIIFFRILRRISKRIRKEKPNKK